MLISCREGIAHRGKADDFRKACRSLGSSLVHERHVQWLGLTLRRCRMFGRPYLP